MRQSVRKAVIPAAGLGTRFLPATKAQPKEMLPVVDKPAVQHVVEEAVRAGLRDILIITGRGKRSVEDHFDRSFELEHYLEGSGKTELIEALEHQLTVQRRMEAQLESFYDQMERIAVELDSIRGSLLSVSASTDVANQQRLAGDVRALRDELGTLAEGMSEAFEERAA